MRYLHSKRSPCTHMYTWVYFITSSTWYHFPDWLGLLSHTLFLSINVSGKEVNEILQSRYTFNHQVAEEVRRCMQRWPLEQQWEGMWSRSSSARFLMDSTLLFHWKDIVVCHNELPLIWASSTVRLSLETQDVKQCLQDHLMRGQGCFGSVASLN